MKVRYEDGIRLFTRGPKSRSVLAERRPSLEDRPVVVEFREAVRPTNFSLRPPINAVRAPTRRWMADGLLQQD